MRTTSRMVRQSRQAKQSRRWGPAKENARRDDSGRALRVGSGRGNLLPSGKGLGLRNRRPCQQS